MLDHRDLSVGEHPKTMQKHPTSILPFSVAVCLLGLLMGPVSVFGQASDLFFSEYIEGSSLNKAVEIANATGAPVDLAAGGYQLEFYFNGNTSAGTTIALTGVVADGDVYVVADDGADSAILDEADQTPNSNFFNGDDAVVLTKNGVVVDAIGQIGVDPGSEWGSGNISTANNTIRRGVTVCAGDTNASDAFDPVANGEWEGFASNTFDDLGTFAADCGGATAPSIVINEVDADQPSTDSAEFVELFDGGSGNTSLDGLALVFFNGNGDASYNAFDLDGFSTDADGFFVLCGDASNVANCDLDVSPNTNLIQNGADAVALFMADASDFPNGTAVTTNNLIDALVYDTNDSDDAGLLVLLNAGQPQVNEGGNGDQTGHSNQRIPNGDGGARNTDTYDQLPPTPGAANGESVTIPPVVINEVDADQPSTDDAEFIELYDGGVGNTSLNDLILVLYNGSGDASYRAISLAGRSTNAQGYLVVCGDGGNVPNCDVEVNTTTNLIQNGADAVALYVGTPADFPSNTPVTTENLVDAIVYDTNDSDDAGLLVLLNAGQPQVNEGGGANGSTGDSNQRIPNGAGGARNTDTYAQLPPTPGAENVAPPVSSPIVINEVDADQTSTDDAEFVELFDGGTGNTALDGLALVFFNGSGDASYQAFDLDGQTTDADGYFVLCANAATVPNCDLDVDPNTNLIQNGADAVALYQADATDFPNGSAVTTNNLIDALVYDTNDSDDAGLLVLLNAGQPQVNEGGNGNQTGESNQRIPNGTGGARNTDTYAQFTPTPGAENGVLIATEAEIFAIQGTQDVSAFENTIVTTVNNVVTALAPNGFFMQTPADRTDGNALTSDGIFVFTGSAPSVSVGDLVDVTGEVVEFFGLTEFTNSPTVTVVGTGSVPAPVVFSNTLPSPDPTTPSCGINNFECFESMIVQINGGLTTSSNQGFGTDPIAEVFVVADGDRPFREKGIAFEDASDFPPGLPVWDGNPEVFELDPDKLGLPNQIIPEGASFNATGPLGFEFGGFEIWPTTLSITPSSETLPVPVPERASNQATIGSLNMFRFFNDVDDPADTDAQGNTRNDNGNIPSTAEYNLRRSKFASHILEVLGAPDILAVQEAENLSVLQDLAADIQASDPSVVYTAYLVEGNDVGTIDVGYLVRNTVQVDKITQLAKSDTFIDPSDESVDLIHDRPPLLLEGFFLLDGVPELPIAVINVHNRSFNGITGSSGERVRQKRLEQAQSIAQIVQDFQTANPNVGLAVVGDFNDFEFTDGLVDAIGQIRGTVNPSENLLSGPDLVNPNLTNQVETLPADERYSFIFRGSAQVLDHALTTTSLDPSVAGFAFGRGNVDAAETFLDESSPLFASDHDGFALFVNIVPPACPDYLVVSDYASAPADEQAVYVTNVGPTSVNIGGCSLNTFDVFTETAIGAGSVALSGTLAPGETYAATFAEGALPAGPAAFGIYNGAPLADGTPFTTENEITGGVYLSNDLLLGIAHLTMPALDDVYSCVYGGTSVGGPFARPFAPIGDCQAPAKREAAIAQTDVDMLELIRIAADRGQETLASEVPIDFALEQNYPNPFNPQTTIRFAIPEASTVRLAVYDLLGRQVRVLIDGNLNAGWHEMSFDASNLPSGLYLYRLETPSRHYHNTMTLTK